MVLGTTGCTQKLRTAAKNLIGFCSAYAHAVLCADMLQKKVLHTEKAQHKAHMASERTAVCKGVCVCVYSLSFESQTFTNQLPDGGDEVERSSDYLERAKRLLQE